MGEGDRHFGLPGSDCGRPETWEHQPIYRVSCDGQSLFVLPRARSIKWLASGAGHCIKGYTRAVYCLFSLEAMLERFDWLRHRSHPVLLCCTLIRIRTSKGINRRWLESKLVGID